MRTTNKSNNALGNLFFNIESITVLCLSVLHLIPIIQHAWADHYDQPSVG